MGSATWFVLLAFGAALFLFMMLGIDTIFKRIKAQDARAQADHPDHPDHIAPTSTVASGVSRSATPTPPTAATSATRADSDV